MTRQNTPDNTDSGDATAAATPSLSTPLENSLPLGVDIVPGLLPRHTVSLLVGPSYVGKTSLLLPALRDYLVRGELLGHPASTDASGRLQTARLGYLACDRTLSAIGRTLSHLQLPELGYDRLPFHSWQDSLPRLDSPTLSELYDLFEPPRPQLLIIEAIQILMLSGKDLNDFKSVATFFRSLNKFCKDRDVTIMGTTLTPKQRGDEGYVGTDRILGSSAWAQGTASLLMLDRAEPDRENCSHRRLTIYSRSQPTVTEYFDFNTQGHLVPSIRAADWRGELDRRLADISPVELITTAEVLEWGRLLGVQGVTVESWLTQAVRDGRLERTKRGTYRRVVPQ